MVLDESTCRAVLKKQCKIFSKRHYNILSKPCPKKSRTWWLNETIKDITSTGYVITQWEDENNLIFLTLIPNGAGHFIVAHHFLNNKTCLYRAHEVCVVLTQHYLIRLMQAYKETNINNLSEILEDTLGTIIENEIDMNKDTSYELYLPEGMMPIIVEHGHIYVKTFIPESLLGLLQKKYLKESPLILDIKDK